jgi:hypothetical protein
MLASGKKSSQDVARSSFLAVSIPCVSYSLKQLKKKERPPETENNCLLDSAKWLPPHPFK